MLCIFNNNRDADEINIIMQMLCFTSNLLAERARLFCGQFNYMQSLYLIIFEKEGKHVAYLIHSSHAP